MTTIAWTSTSGQTYDLTSEAVNKHAAPLATARENGFTMRNRIVWSDVTAPTMTNKVMNVLKLLRVPARTVIEDVFLVAPAGTSGTTHQVDNSIVISSGIAGIGFIAYDSKSWNNASTVAKGFAQGEVLKSKIWESASSQLCLPTATTSPKGSVRAVKAIIAGANHGWADGGDDAQGGVHFPHGGYITFQLTEGTGSVTGAGSWDAAFSGTLEVVARGFQVPE